MSSNSEEAASLAMCLATWSMPPMVLKAVLELNILEIIKKHGPASQLTAAHIVSQLPAATTNPNAVMSVDRMLRLLASFSVLTCSIQDGPDGGIERMYGLGPACEYLTKNEDGVSFAAFALLMQDKVIMDACNNMKDAILGGGIPFNQTHGMNIFEYISKDSRFGEVFYNGMKHHSIIVTKKILEIYQGFRVYLLLLMLEVLQEIQLASLSTNILILMASTLTFLMSSKMHPLTLWTFHTASDEQCIKLLKNCHTALPNNGKVIVCEYIVPEVPETSYSANTAFIFDAIMFAMPGGKERTKRQYQALGKEAGFLSFQLVCSACDTWIIEFMKDDPIRTD